LIDFSRNHFELFGFQVRFAIDEAALDRVYRDLQRAIHPDRFAGEGDAQKRLALQASARANEAYKTLRDPVTRAEYLLSLRGIDPASPSQSAMPVEFLTRQLERREVAEQAQSTHDIRALRALIDEVRDEAGELGVEVARLLDRGDARDAAMRVREWRFLAKLADDLDEACASITVP